MGNPCRASLRQAASRSGQRELHMSRVVRERGSVSPAAVCGLSYVCVRPFIVWFLAEGSPPLRARGPGLRGLRSACPSPSWEMISKQSLCRPWRDSEGVRQRRRVPPYAPLPSLDPCVAVLHWWGERPALIPRTAQRAVLGRHARRRSEASLPLPRVWTITSAAPPHSRRRPTAVSGRA